VKNRDILISSIAAALASAITYLAQMAMWFGAGRRDGEQRSRSPLGGLLMLLLAPMAAGLIRMAISRTREFSADATSARTLGNAQPMIDALAKLDSIGRQIPLDVSPSMSHLYIMQPFSGRSLSRLFSTHPPTAERIAALRRVPVNGFQPIIAIQKRNLQSLWQVGSPGKRISFEKSPLPCERRLTQDLALPAEEHQALQREGSNIDLSGCNAERSGVLPNN
jgi:hypothetical protein